MGIMRSLGTIAAYFLISQNKIKLLLITIHKVYLQTLRAAAAHQPGIISDIGIRTFVDPRQQGGKLNEVTKET